MATKPTRTIGYTLTQVIPDQPFVDSNGRLSMWAAQWAQRLQAYVGPPTTTTTSGKGSSLTLSESVTNVTNALEAAQGAQGVDAATLARLQMVEQRLAMVPALPPQAAPAPLMPLMPLLDLPSTGGAGSGSIYAPLVNGDLPGPTLIADPFGQCIMVPIT